MDTAIETAFPAHSPTPTTAELFPESRAPAVVPPPSPPRNIVERLLRSPRELLEELDHMAPAETVRALLLVLVLGAGAFGAVIGTYRGGIQILYCAIKVPLLLLATLIVCSPAFVALARAFGTGLAAREVITVTLAACARFALVLAGLAPVVWLLAGWLGYHGVVVTLVLACGVAGLAASTLLFGGLGRRAGGAWLAGMAFVTVFGLVGAQTSWLLRPFLVRPRTTHVPFLRHLEGDLFHAAQTSVRSAAGTYDEEGGAWLGGAVRGRAAPPPKADCDAREGACD